MDAINTYTPSCACQDSAIQPYVQASQAQLAAVSSSQSIDLDLVTEEGDKVTLSIDARASALYASFGEVEMDAERMFGQWSELSAGQYERDISLTVAGDLNRQERREIGKVIKSINRMMHNFIQGKLGPMMANTKKLGRLETVDSLEIKMSYERQVVVAQQSQYNQFGQPATVPALETEAAALPLATEARSLVQDMVREMDSTPAPRERILEMTEHLFKAHRRRARRLGPMGGRVMDHIRDLFKTAMGVSQMFEPAETVLSAAADDIAS